jgi:hypothetical protein
VRRRTVVEPQALGWLLEVKPDNVDEGFPAHPQRWGRRRR